MKLTEVQQQAIQARMNLIVGATIYDRLFLGANVDEVTEDTAAPSVRTRGNTVNPIKAERLRHADTTSTIWPIGSISSPNASGASAWQIRDGAPINPSL